MFGIWCFFFVLVDEINCEVNKKVLINLTDYLKTGEELSEWGVFFVFHLESGTANNDRTGLSDKHIEAPPFVVI